MKNYTLLFTFIFVLFSCSSENSDKNTEYYGKWVQYTDAQYADDPSSNQYSYEFNRNKTFTKTRNYDNTTTRLSGTFKIINSEGRTHFVLTYTERNSLISNCNGSLSESFTLDNLGYLNDDAVACDRYGKYKKAK